jgi:hypothetical protein
MREREYSDTRVTPQGGQSEAAYIIQGGPEDAADHPSAPMTVTIAFAGGRQRRWRGCGRGRRPDHLAASAATPPLSRERDSAADAPFQ